MSWPDTVHRRHFIALTLLFALGLLWPALINGGPLLFHDSISYVNQGRQAVEGAAALLPKFGRAGADGAPSFEAAAASATYIRSLSWSGFAYLGSAAVPGLWGPVLVQSGLIATLVMLLLAPVTGARMSLLIATLAVLAAFTALPWFASYVMPDILAAVPILAGMLLVQDPAIVSRTTLQLALVALVVAFAIASHTGYVPLGAALAAAVILVLALQRRLSPRLAIVAIAPLLIAVGANMAAAKLAFDTPELAPKRLPILLARSIEDGPARWYLAKACPEAGYVICRHIADMPTSQGAVLWGPDSLLAKLSEREVDALRAEETQILIGAFRAYPAEQTWAFVGNGVQQLLAFGTDDFRWGNARPGADGKLVTDMFAGAGNRTGLDRVGTIQTLAVLLAVAAIIALVLKDRLTARPDERALLFIVLVGLLANAAVFGGLSAPVDRYQARIIWLVPMLAMIFGINRFRGAVKT